MARIRCAGAGGQRGQASVELLGTLPFLLVSVLIVAQLVAAGHSLWSAGLAARAGARAAVVGEDPAQAARRALPLPLREGARIEAGAATDPVTVGVAVPDVFPGGAQIRVAAEFGLKGDGH